MTAEGGLTVAITGPTGGIGTALIRALEAEPAVARIVGMARRPFDPAERGWKKVTYRRGDVLDRAGVEGLVEGADVVVHLAFVIMGGSGETEGVNVEGSRNVFEAAVSAGAQRLVYASSVAAYGFHEDNPIPLTEDVPARGTDDHYYSRQKAAVEGVLDEVVSGADIDAYVFRPCIVAGPDALLLIENIPYVQLSDRLPDAVVRLFDVVPALKPVIPDPGVPFQLVHVDDVASALAAATLGSGEPGVYNLAAEGELTMRDLAEALDWYSVPVPELAVDAAAELVARVPFMPAEAQWINAMRTPVLMDTAKARAKLDWTPRHDAHETLMETVLAARRDRLIR